MPKWLMFTIPASRPLDTRWVRLERVGEHVRGQAEGQAVGAAQGFLGVLEARDRRYRAERLVHHQLGVVRQVRLPRSGRRRSPCRRCVAARHDLARRGWLASSRNCSIDAIRRSCASGPICVPSSRPLPTLIELDDLGEAVPGTCHRLFPGRRSAGRGDAHLAGVAQLEARQHLGRTARCRHRRRPVPANDRPTPSSRASCERRPARPVACPPARSP